MLKNKIIVKKIRNIFILLMAIIIMLGAYHNIRNSKAENVIQIELEIADKSNILSAQTITVDATETSDGNYLINLPISVNKNIVSKYYTSSGEEIEVDVENNIATMQLTEEEVANKKAQLQTDYDTKEVTDAKSGEKKLLYKKLLTNEPVTEEHDETSKSNEATQSNSTTKNETSAQKETEKQSEIKNATQDSQNTDNKENEENQDVIATGYMPIDAKMEVKEIDLATLTSVKIPDEKQTMQKAYEVSIYQMVEKKKDESNSESNSASTNSDEANAGKAQTNSDATNENQTQETYDVTNTNEAQTNPDSTLNSETEGANKTTDVNTETNTNLAVDSETQNVEMERVEYDPSIYEEKVTIITKNEQVNVITTVYALEKDNKVAKVESTTDNAKNETKFETEKTGETVKYVIATEEIPADVNNTTDNDTITSDDKINNSDDVTTNDNNITNVGASSSTTSTPTWRVENINKDKTNKRVTADLVVASANFTSVNDSTLTTDDITVTVDGEVNKIITKNLGTPTFSTNASTGLKEIKYILTLDNWEEAARQAGKSFLEYSGSVKIEIAEGIESSKPSELFDQDGSNTNGLHIGDFINYDAGTWTQDEINSIRTGLKTNLQTANGSTNLPTKGYQFGGFAAGSSRNGNATPSDDTYNYIKDTSTNSAITGWRVFDVDGDNVTLISAGNPEGYYHENRSTSGYISEYVLSGNINSNFSASTANQYQKRDWNVYINEKQKATNAIPLTKSRLDTWYTKYLSITNANTDHKSTVQKIYNETYVKIQNIIDNYSHYFLAETITVNSDCLCTFNPNSRRVLYANKGAEGVRILITLSSDVLFGSTKTGTKTLTGGNMDTYGGNQTYNCWNIVTGNSSGSTGSSQKQVLDLGQVDFINPEYTYKYANTEIDHDKKKVTVVFDVTDKYFSTSALTTDTIASNITVNFEGKEATNATKELSKLSDITETINGTTKKVGEKYQLVVSNLDQGNGGDYSGIMTLVFHAGIVTDTSNNNSVAKTITIGVDDPIDTGSTDGPYLPTGFTHVEGTSLENGYTVQDSEGNQFVWVEVPKTAEVYSTAGLNITEFTTDAYTKIENDLHTYTSAYREEECTDEWAENAGDTQATIGMTNEQYSKLKQKMLRSVYQNGGFYIGKYETGIEGTPRTSGDANTMPTETPVIKQNAYPYNYVTSSQAQTIASGFTSNLDGYTSSLLFGVQWDLTLKYLETKGATQAELKKDSNAWGNYYTSLWNITNTSSKYSTDKGSTWKKGAYGKKSSSVGVLLSTGASDKFTKQGIYDLAGNVYEWTLEAYSSYSTYACISRGGSYRTSDISGARSRDIFNNSTDTNDYIGYRVALYKDSTQNSSSDTSDSKKPVIVDVVDPIWKVENVNINKTNKKVTADLIATDKYLTGVENSTLTIDDITLTIDGETNTVITKTLSAPTFSENASTGLKEIKYTLTLDNWEESARQAGKSFLEYSGSAKIIIKAGTVIDSAGGSSGVKPSELFDQDGSNTNGLHIGDFVDYDAGTWTQDEINAIQTGLKTDLQTANGTATLPTNGFQFGGFTAGSSRNENATPYTDVGSDSINLVKYIKDEINGNAITGWRVFDIDGDSVTLISAGNPEDYYHENGLYNYNYGYTSEYILTGNINDNWSNTEAEEYQKRNWNVYINEKQKAINAIPLTKDKLENWYKKYIGIASDVDLGSSLHQTEFQKIYEEPYIKYQNMIDNSSMYWLNTAYDQIYLFYFNPLNRKVFSNVNSENYGIRMLVTLSLDVLFNPEKTGTKTLTGGNMGTYGGKQTYNCWSIATGSNGNANGENNSSKEQTLDLGQVDFINPEFTYKYANTTIDHDKKKVTVVFDVTDKYFSTSALTTDTTASNITVKFEGKEATNATKELSKLSDITATINGTEKKVGEKYQLVVSNLDQGNGGDYSGIMTLVFPAGIVTDTSSNNSLTKTITIGVDEDGSSIKGAKPSELFDSTGSDTNKLHIGDFINYDAGTWTQEEINSIQTGLKTNLQTANGSTESPTSFLQFGGFTAGSSRNENATPNSINYIKDKTTGTTVTGWRVFDIDGDSITLISAGNPEKYKPTYGTTDGGVINQYILTGDGSYGNWTTSSPNDYQIRDWGVYVNEEQKATSARAFDEDYLNSWYSKYINNSNSSKDFEVLYKEPYLKYQNIIDNNSTYWLCMHSYANPENMFYVWPNPSKLVSDDNNYSASGVRVLVTLSPDVLLSSERTGTKTLTGGNMDTYGGDQTFNCWNIVTATEGESGSKDPVIVDVVDPVWKVENVKQDTENQKVTLDLVATDKYLTGVENSTLTTDDITISVDGDENANNVIKKTLSEPEFISAKEPYIPDGFTHVEGTNLSNGYTVQDNKGNQYIWIEVPQTKKVYQIAGLGITEFSTSDYTKIEKDLQTYTGIYRNKTEFEDEWYSQETTGLTSSQYTELKQKMLKSVYQNGGFYIGKYETGIENRYRTSGSTTTTPTETPVIKQNAFPYEFVTCSQAQTLSSKFASDLNGYTSSLMFGVQWDLILKYLETKGTTQAELNEDSTNWGNYSNNTWKITNTNALYADNGTNWRYCSYGETGGAAIQLTTGASDTFCKQGIYDLAGNVEEWTLEYSNDPAVPGVVRGSEFHFYGVGSPASKRWYMKKNYYGYEIGFRVALYKDEAQDSGTSNSGSKTSTDPKEIRYTLTLDNWEEAAKQAGKSYYEYSGATTLKIAAGTITDDATGAEEGISDGKRNTSKEQTFDLGKIDVLAPVIERVSSDIDMTKQTATMVFNVSDKYLNTSDAITTNEITVLVNGTASNSVSKTLTRVTENDATATIDGTTRTVSQQYKLTVSGFATDADQVKIRFNKGAATDTNGNGNEEKDIAVYNQLVSTSTETKSNSPFLENASIERQKVEKIIFKESLDGINDTKWDVSAQKDNSIIAWYEKNDKGFFTVYIGSYGVINSNKNASYLFAYIGYDSGCSVTGDTKATDGTERPLIENLDLLNVEFSTNMEKMFMNFGYNTMKSFSLGRNFKTSNAQNMDRMFCQVGYIAMTSFDLGTNFDTSNVTDMQYMFYDFGHKALTSLSLGDKFNTSKVTNMASMFCQVGYDALKTLDLGDKFDTSNVTNMSYMFSTLGGQRMTSLNLGDKFNTSNVTNMTSMFWQTGGGLMETLDLGPAFTKIAKENSNMFTKAGKIGAIIYAPESIYKSKTSFKLSSTDTTTAEGAIAVTDAKKIKIVPKYKPEWTLEGASIDTANKALKINIKGATKADNYTSEVTTALSVEDISIWIDGEEVTGLSKAITTANPSTGASVTQTITLTNFEEAFRQAGKSYKEWSGNITLKIAGRGESTDTYTANTLTDSYGNQSMSATDETGTWIDIDFKDETTSSANENGKMFADFVSPAVIYEYANTVIDHDTKTVTVVFDITDKYFSTSSLAEDSTASKIKVNFEGKEATNATKALTKLSDITATVNGVENTKVGEKYQLVVSNLDQGQGGDYSGIMTLAFPADIATDLSNNSNIAKTITIGVDEPSSGDGNASNGPYLPTGFTHVEGTSLENGYTVQDSKGNQFIWVEVPRKADVYPTAGLKITEFTTDAYTKIENDLHTYTSVYRKDEFTDEWGTKENNYSQDSTGMTSDQYTELKQKMLKSIYQNGGFYIGKYETGIEGTPRTSGDANTMPTETPVIKQNAYPYNWVTSSQAQTIASKFASGLNGYTSSLLFGLQWDLTLKYLESKGVTQAELNEDSTNWGNYYDNLWNITNINSKYSTNGRTWTNGAYGKKSSSVEVLLSTGASDTFSKQGIYDLAGNVLEWTLEAYSFAYRAYRGGGYGATDRNAASYRYYYDYPTVTSTYIGSRLALYKDVAQATDSDAPGTGSKPVIVDVVDPVWKVENINIDQENQKLTAEVIATDKYLTGIENSTLTTNDITITVDGDENANNVITKTLSAPTFSENAETGLKEIKYTLTLDNWEESAKQAGKSYLEYSGLTKIKIAEGTVVDDAEGALEPGQVSDGKHNTSKEQTFELGHVDFIKPGFTYKYANTEINHDTKTVTVVFDITDKYFSASQLATDAVASNIKVNFEGKEATNATKVLTKLSDITETVNGVENTKVGEKYQLVVSNLDQGNGGDYSGIMTLCFNEGAITDTAGNGNVAKVITIGVDDPKGDEQQPPVIVDVVDPVWKVENVKQDTENQKVTLDLVATDKYLTGVENSTLTTDDITISVDGDENANNAIKKTLSEPTFSGDGPYIPTGYSHVAGTSLDNGFTVQDSKGNQFVWVEVPKTADVYPTAGLKITEFTTDAYTKIENDLHTYTSVYRIDRYTDEWGTNENNYSQDSTGMTSDQYTELKQKMLRSVYQNGGFYIGKYETGIENTYRTSGSANTTPTETPVIKQNAYPYNYVKSSQAQTIASGFASNLNGYTSSLLFGVQWDLTLKYLETKGATQAELKEDSTNWGNYYDNLWNITNTNSKYSTDYGDTWTNGAYGKKTGGVAILLSTGASDTFSKQGIHDLAGNVHEWTLEAYSFAYRAYRGGFYGATGRDTASIRYNGGPTDTHTYIGSRLALYKNVALATDSDAPGTGSSVGTGTTSGTGSTSTTDLKEIRYTLTLDNWEEAAKQAGKSYYEYSGATTLKIAAGTITDDATGAEEGISDGKRNTSKEQTLDIGKIDILRPVIERETAEVNMGDQTATVVFNVSDKYLNTSDTITANDITVILNGTETSTVTKTITRVTENDATATIEGTEKTVLQQYKLVLSGLGSNIKQLKIRIAEGSVIDLNGNGNVQKNISIYNTLKTTATESKADSAFLGNSSIQRQNIENITFERSIPKTVYNEATGKFIDTTAWDVSASEDNSIIAWYETSNTNGAIKVHIGSEDEIFANTNSAFLFSYIGYADICTATETITNISLLNVSGASSMYAMFQFTGYKSMTSLDLGSNFNTQSAKNMSFMFNGTGYMSMTNLNLGSKFIPSKVTNMKAMFQSTGYTAMTSLDLGENFDTSKVTDMSYMFFNAGYTAMTSLNLGNNFDTSSATTMSAMFSKVGYTALESLDLKNKFNTSNVTTMRTMFENAGYTAMTSLNLGENFDTSSVTDMSYMFNKCGYTAMDSLNLGNKFNTSNVTNMFVMFQHTGHTKMTSLDLGDKFDTSSVTDMTGMFLGTGYVAMTSLNLRDKFDTSNVTSMYATFQETGYTAMTSLYLGDKFDTSKVTNMKDMFYKTGALSMTNLDFGPAFTKIADNHEDMFIDTGKNGEVVINVPESIYKNRKSFKLSSTDSTTAEGTLIVNSIVREADDGTKTLSERDVTVVPKYKPEWTVTSTVVDKANKALKINLKGATNANNYTSDVTTALDANAISIWIDGEEITGVSKTVTTANPSTGASVTQIITLTDFEEAVRQAGKSYKEWSGNITLKIAGRGEATSTYTANILTDKYGNQSMSASDETGIWIDVDFKDATLGTSSEDGKMFTDFITPEFTYEYANTTIDHDTKKVTVVFDITDKYFDKSSLSEDTTASQITVDFEGTEATNATKELTKLSDITATINGVENTKIGEKYKLVVSNLDQGQGGDYSGIMKLAFKAGELNADGSLKSGMVDKSGNLSIDKTITIGVDEPKTDGENNDGVIVDVVDPIWKVENINIDSASQKVTAEVIATDKYLTGIANSTLTTNDITITVDGDANANNVITKTLSEPTFSENASTGLKEIRYILTLENWEEAEKQTGKSFLEYSGTTKITIAEGTVTDNAGGSNGVSPSSLFDQAGSNTDGLHIGDFVDYDAGTWTQEEINSIKTGLKTNLQTANGSTSLPTKEFQFGGFTAGSSRNGNATPYNTSYNYVKNVATGNAVTGWRVFDIDEDSVTLISAGNPEDYYEKYVTNSENGYIYEYILSGNVSDQWSTGQTEKDKYKVRDWTVYINKKQKATNAMPLTMDKIYTWSEKYLGDTLYGKIYQSTYIKYQSLIDNYSYYFVATNANKDRLYASNPKSTENNFIFNSNFLGSNALGIRMIVTLSSDVLFNPEKTGTKTLTGGNMDTYGGDQTYNCWSIATGGISDGKHNTSKEQTFELGHVDFIKPRIEKESSVRDVEAKTETITFNVVDKYLDTTKILTADDIKVLVDGEEATTLTKTFTRVAENDTSAMVNGSTQVVSQQYQLVLSGFDVGRTEEEANRSFANWSGTVTIEVAEGKIKDQENEIASNGGISGGNANEATTIKGDFVDYINPELIYKHQDVDINKEGKTYTMTFTVTDKYYKSGKIELEDLTINMQNGQLDAEGNEKIYNLKNEKGIEIALRAEEITAQDVPITGTTGDVETASDLLIGHKYTLTISHLEQLEIKEGATTADYSGIITVAVPANKVIDKGPSGNGTSSNGNIATTVTSGANIPGGTIPDDAKVVDVVTPIWTKVTSSASAIDPADKTTSTATVKFRGTDTYFATNTLTEEQIKVFVNGTEVTTGITKTLSEATALNEQRKAFGSDTITTKQYGVEYTLTITGFAQNADQVKVQIPAGCMTDEFGNSNKVTDLIVYNVLRNTTSENSETGAFLGNASIQRQNIENVTFERSIPSTVYNTETGEYVDTTAWDASARQDKSIIAWYETSNSNGALKVHIGSNDEIFGNQNSSYLFRAIGYSNICTATEAITNIGLLNVSSVTNMECMFWQTGWNAMTNFNLGDKFDTGNVTNMRKMLSGVGYNAMTDISLGSEFDTGKVTDMSRMFENTGYYAMKKFDLGDKFDTSSVKDMSYMFTHCGVKLMTDIDLGEDFNTENVTNMNYMFYSIGATAMTSLDLGDKFDTSKVTTMEAMFSRTGNTAMTSLDLGEKFDTRKVTNMKSMFQGCGATAMTTLNLGPAFTKIPAESTNFMTNCGTTGLVIYAPESVYANNGEFIISEN